MRAAKPVRLPAPARTMGSESDPDLEPGMRAARAAAGMRKADQVGDFLP
jgi:hypothetical protein